MREKLELGSAASVPYTLYYTFKLNGINWYCFLNSELIGKSQRGALRTSIMFLEVCPFMMNHIKEDKIDT